MFRFLINGLFFIGACHASSWTYEDKDDWPTVHPDYCSGDRQSPIDLTPENAVVDPTITTKLHFSSGYYSSALKGTMANNGHSAQFTLDPDQNVFVSGGPIAPGDSFELLQMHLHWGSSPDKGSEHTLDGHRFPLEMHMVHMNTKYATTDEADVNGDGYLALGVFFDVADSGESSPEHDLLEAFGHLANSVRRRKRSTLSSYDTTLDVGSGLFGNPNMDWDNYLNYDGSLTTPMCTEAVVWINMVHPLSVSTGLLNVLNELSNGEGGVITDNFRPVQPLNGRTINKPGDNVPYQY